MSKVIRDKKAAEARAEYGGLEGAKGASTRKFGAKKVTQRRHGSKGTLAEISPDFIDHSQDNNLENIEYDVHDLEILGKSFAAED